MSNPVDSGAYDPNPSHPVTGRGGNSDVNPSKSAGDSLVQSSTSYDPGASTGDWAGGINPRTMEDVEHSMPSDSVLGSSQNNNPK